MNRAPPIEKQPKATKLHCATCAHFIDYGTAVRPKSTVCGMRVTEMVGASKITPLYKAVESDWYCSWWMTKGEWKLISGLRAALYEIKEALEKVPFADVEDE